MTSDFTIINQTRRTLEIYRIGRLSPNESVTITGDFWEREMTPEDRDEIREMLRDGRLGQVPADGYTQERKPSMPQQTDRDVVLATNEYAFVLNRTSGRVNALVGPYKDTLDENKRLVIFNEKSKKFEEARLDQAVQLFDIAPEGWYAVVKNPSQGSPHPSQGVNEDSKLIIGQKVNIPGPVSFARFPGQMVRILPGHHLRSNEYLVCRVYDEKEARESIAEAILKPQTDDSSDKMGSRPGLRAEDMVMGKLLIIRGTDYSFFIPPTGIEVLAEEDDEGNRVYTRQAVTLEQLEYCVLLGEDGNKKYVYGPSVVFPEPTQQFMTRGGARKFRAIELNQLQGIYCKVISAYTDENGVAHEVGEELFITGGENGQRIFYPRPEIAIIKYGDSIKHYATAIPEGEARYCLERESGKIRLVKGPCMWLPDPRFEVPIRRVLSKSQVSLLYPNNAEAAKYNEMLREVTDAGGAEFVTERNLTQHRKGATRSLSFASNTLSEALFESVSEELAGDEFKRSSNYHKAPSITLDTKYEGAVTMDIWTGYATLFVRKTGDRKVVVGPKTVLLEYDESPDVLKLSKGKPKGSEPPVRTVYLRVKQNRVSDLVEVETADLVPCTIRLVYLIDFEGADPNKWFEVEDYVKFVTDHCRSRLRNAVKRVGIEEFHERSIDIVRDTILGESAEGQRTGRAFPENSSRIYEVDVLDLKIGNSEIEKLLVAAQRDTVRDTLEMKRQRRLLEVVRETEEHSQETDRLQAQTKVAQIRLEAETKKIEDEIRTETLARRQQLTEQEQEGERAKEERQKAIVAAVVAHQQMEEDFKLSSAARRNELDKDRLAAETKSFADRAAAIQSDLIAALQTLASTSAASEMAESLGVAAYLNGESVYATLRKLLAGSGFEKYLPEVPVNGGSKYQFTTMPAPQPQQ